MNFINKNEFCFRLIVKTVFVFIFLGINCAYSNDINEDFTPLYKGVSYRLLEKNNGSLKIHQIKIDTDDPDVEIFTTAPNKNGYETPAIKPSTFLKKEKAQVVMNGTGYSPAQTQAEGMPKRSKSMAVYKGIKYAELQNEDAVFVVLNDGTKKILKREELEAYEGTISMGIGAWPWAGVPGLLIDNGVSRVPSELTHDEQAARSAVGISEDGKSLYWVVVQGRPRKESIFKELITDGVSLYNLVSIMEELGCYRAMNLDGGGSSALVIENIINGKPLVLNIPSDLKGERAVGNHLGLKAPRILDAEIEEAKQLRTFLAIQENTAFFDLLNNSEATLLNKYMDPTKRTRLDSKNITSLTLNKLYEHFGIHKYSDSNPAYDLVINESLNYNENLDFMKFFSECNFDLSDNIMRLSDLKMVGKNEQDSDFSGTYMDSKKVFYFVNHVQSVKNEFIGSKLLNLIMGTETTSVAKLLKDQPKMIATRMVRGFVMGDKLDKVNGCKKRLTGEIDLSIAMNFIGLIDCDKWNTGYVQVGHQNDEDDRKLDYTEIYAAARIGYNHSFSFASNLKKLRAPQNDPLCLKQIWLNAKDDGESSKEILSTMQRIVAIPDSQLVMTILECWAALSEIGESFKIEEAFDMASKLIDRKTAFKKTLDERN